MAKTIPNYVYEAIKVICVNCQKDITNLFYSTEWDRKRMCDECFNKILGSE